MPKYASQIKLHWLEILGHCRTYWSISYWCWKYSKTTMVIKGCTCLATRFPLAVVLKQFLSWHQQAWRKPRKPSWHHHTPDLHSSCSLRHILILPSACCSRNTDSLKQITYILVHSWQESTFFLLSHIHFKVQWDFRSDTTPYNHWYLKLLFLKLCQNSCSYLFFHFLWPQVINTFLSTAEWMEKSTIKQPMNVTDI